MPVYFRGWCGHHRAGEMAPRQTRVAPVSVRNVYISAPSADNMPLQIQCYRICSYVCCDGLTTHVHATALLKNLTVLSRNPSPLQPSPCVCIPNYFHLIDHPDA